MDRPTGFLTLGQVCNLTGLCRSTIYRLRLNGQFVAAQPLSRGRIGFWKPDVGAWQACRAEAEEAAGLRPVTDGGRRPRNGRRAPARRSRAPE
jgi:predicted DNA-binding transcriptional regulator AlpA